MIEHTVVDGREPAGHYRLVTTVTDHIDVPAAELVAAYAQRWEIWGPNPESRGKIWAKQKAPDLDFS